MNRFSRDIITSFGSRQNIDYLYGRLAGGFESAAVRQYLNLHLENAVRNFERKIAAELREADPLVGLETEYYIDEYNRQFLGERSRFIEDNLMRKVDPSTEITDGAITSFSKRSDYEKDADDILEEWKMNAKPSPQLREDPMTGAGPYAARGCRGAIMTGVVSIDQSGRNTDNHIRQLYHDPYLMSMNYYALPHEMKGLGVRDPANDERLLQRRIFRSNEEGVENGIPMYEKRLYGRNYDRDIGETLNNSQQHDNFNYRHDMQSLYDRVDGRSEYGVEKKRISHNTHDEYL